MSWDEIAEDEGIPKRTLQHFWKRWGENPGLRPEFHEVGGELARRLRAMQGWGHSRSHE